MYPINKPINGRKKTASQGKKKKKYTVGFKTFNKRYSQMFSQEYFVRSWGYTLCVLARDDECKQTSSVYNENCRVHCKDVHHSILLTTLTGSVMDARVSRPGEMTEISGRRGLARPPSSAAVDSNTAISSSSSKGHPHGEDKDSAMLTCSKEVFMSKYQVITTHLNLVVNQEMHVKSPCKASLYIGIRIQNKDIFICQTKMFSKP